MIKRKKRNIGIVAIACTILLVVFTVTLSFLYSKNISKENNLVLLADGSSSQQIYMLRKVHEYHFYSVLGYTYQDIQNAIDNVNTDLLLEVEQEAFDQY